MLRRFLVASALVCAAGGTAFAADLPNTKAPPMYAPPPPPAFTWSGLYVGGQVGYEWGHTTPTLFGPTTPGVLPGSSESGIVGGAHVGYNFQFSQFVFGLEGDVNGASYNGGNGAGIVGYTSREPVESSIRGRLGYAFDRVLFYGTGGVAFGDFHDTYAGPGGFDSIWRERTGWTAGAGIEYALTNNWSVRAEYRYTDFGRINDFLPVSAPGDTASRHERDNRVQVGFSYKFDMFAPPAPIISKY